MRLKDLKDRIFRLLGEFKGQKMGMVGLGIIIVLIIISIFAPVIAPNTNGEWSNITGRWSDLPENADPVWVDYILPGTRARHVEKERPDTTEGPTSVAGGEIQSLIYEYDMEYDYPPSEVSVFLKGTSASNTVTTFINLERPDGEQIDLISEEIGSNGTFNSRFSIIGSEQGRDTLYNFGAQFQEGEIPDTEDVNMAKVLFGKANEEMLSDPEPLEGEYRLRVEVFGNDIELDQEGSRVLFKGRVYGLMGTDSSRRDIALGWVWGARYALLIGGIVATFSVAIATVYGMTSAYYGGWVDEIMQRINEIMLGIPLLPVLIITMYAIERSIWIFILVYTILSWRGIAKVIRSRGIQIRQDTYIEAAQSLGASGKRIILRHMVPQILPFAVAEAALLVPLVIVAEAGLAVLGLGDPRVVTWGRMLSQAHSSGAVVSGWWWWVLLPGLGITLLGFAFIASGMAIERIVNPKMQQR